MKLKLVQHLHSATFSSCCLSFEKPMKRNIYHLGRNKKNFKLVQTSIATEKGHMNQGRKQLQSLNENSFPQ